MDIPSNLPDVQMYDWLTQKHILLAYNGEVDEELIDMLVQLAEKALKKASSKLKARKKIVNILIESLQNSYHYTQSLRDTNIPAQVVTSPFFIICKETEPTHEEHTSETPIPSEKLNNFWIVTGNWVEKSIETQLKQRIQYLESLTDAQLQSAYIVTLNKNNLPTSGGAGLGLIDIMRRSDRQVFFEFKETESNFSVFMLKIKIN